MKIYVKLKTMDKIKNMASKFEDCKFLEHGAIEIPIKISESITEIYLFRKHLHEFCGKYIEVFEFDGKYIEEKTKFIIAQEIISKVKYENNEKGYSIIIKLKDYEKFTKCVNNLKKEVVI